MIPALIRDFPEEYKKYYSMKEFRYNNITQPNRNRLLFMDSSVDGVKTGHTEAAGYCLISSALRDQRRLLSVVLGTKSGKPSTVRRETWPMGPKRGLFRHTANEGVLT